MENSAGDPWLMRIEGALSAHFKQPDGPSRQGTDWKVGLKRGEELHTIFVRTYLSPDATASTRADTNYQGQTVMGYVNDLLRSGWSPADPVPSTIVIQNPTGVAAAPKKKSWWRIW
jgi:hypothetical protein